ncbi:MAG: alpha-L-fucosidase [Chitinophagaceae bacterium]|nr:alpha-L-fucosidase [Chitinophagaceae bacterium]
MFRFSFILSIFFLLPQALRAQPKPSPSQQAWHDMEYYFFFHFGPNTFTGLEWGHGTEKADLFNPLELDCRQWCRIAKAAGAKGVIITAKHHDGFCLWPSKYSTHTVRESQWRNGKGDVLKELSQACKEYGLKFGVYISPWDRNHPDYGTEKYNDVFVNMMKEIFTLYGPVWELWWDGANGEGPNGKMQVYDWPRFRETVKKLSPQTVIFSDVGPHLRWVGNEAGFAGRTNWNTLDTAGFTPGKGAPSQDTLRTGNKYGKAWIPAECDVSIRPGWFYHKEEDDKVRSPENLFDLWLKSVGRGANLLLNIPPDGRGKIHPKDSAALIDFRIIRDKNFVVNLAKQAKIRWVSDGYSRITKKLVDGNAASGLTISRNGQQYPEFIFSKPVKINCVVLRENLLSGQYCSGFRVVLKKEGREVRTISGTTIGRKRILTFPVTEADAVLIYVDESKGPVTIGETGFYLINEQLIEK